MNYKKIIHIICYLFFIWLGVRLIWMGMLKEIFPLEIFTGMASLAIYIGLAFLVLAFGIYKQFVWAKQIAAAIALLIALILPLVFNSPMITYVLIGSKNPNITISQTVLWFVPLEVFLLAIVFFIDPKKKKT